MLIRLASISAFAAALSLTASRADAQGQEADQPSDSLLQAPDTPWAPRVDGTIEDDEWADAAVIEFENGEELLACRSGGVLYLGVRPRASGILTVAVASGDHVHVLHASNAIGRAEYKRTPDVLWRLKEEFEWVRAGKGPLRELEDLGWAASTIPWARDGCMEMAISLDYWERIRDERGRRNAPDDDEPATLAIGFWSEAAEGVSWTFPPLTEDELAEERFHQGWLSPDAQFETARWLAWPTD